MNEDSEKAMARRVMLFETWRFLEGKCWGFEHRLQASIDF